MGQRIIVRLEHRRGYPVEIGGGNTRPVAASDSESAIRCQGASPRRSHVTQR
jgi:hypothetical protein